MTDAGINPNLLWAAGGIVSDAADIAHFYAALLSGKLLAPTELSAMKQTVQGPGGPDGLGIFALDSGCGRAWGHFGEILDYQTYVEASEDGRRVAVVSLRSGPHGSANSDVPLGKLVCRSEWSRPQTSR